MSTEPRADRLIADLDTALHQVVGLHRAETVADWLASKTTSYLIRRRVLVAHHFDIQPAALIHDPALGTLGIVECVLATEPAQVAAQVRRHVDVATYTRHLVLRDRARGERLAHTVELVLLAANETDADRQVLTEIGNTLRALVRSTDSLYHVGIGLLTWNGGATPFHGQLRRALPWLLRATRQWFASPRSQPPALAATPARRLQSLQLNHYRLPGERELKLAPAPVHLIHGANGSGKSSLVEALELVASGRIERLERAGETHYERVIRSRGQTHPATIALRFEDDEPARTKVWQVTATGLDQAPAGRVNASSFRLDQPLMERLISQFPHERANTFLQAFFPETAASFEAYLAASKARDEALAALASVVDRLVAARSALEPFKDWRGGTATPTRKTFPALLGAWIEMTVLRDLAQREREVRATLRAARATGWLALPLKPRDAALVAELAGSEPTPFEQREPVWAEAVEMLQKELASFRPVSRSEQRRAETPLAVAEEQSRALNAVSRWLFAETILQSYGDFGDKLTRVIAAGEAPTYGPLVIGAENWATPVFNDLEAMLKACAALVSEQPAVAWPGKGTCVEYETAARHQQALLDAGAEVSAGFLDKLRADEGASSEYDGSLIAAVNELLALFTPARWGYDDLQLPPQLADGRLGLRMELGADEQAVRAELHLNTAELNAFTVALFLLCTGRVVKPFGLIVLDDPLQNMDELTSTALARGVAKLVRLWRDLDRRDEILFLFHGAEDLERFQRELPAAVYRLPWLSPSAGPQPLPAISAEPGAARELQAQELGGLFDAA
ncbi:MAG: hypothetical protein E6Q43_03150 [Dokdonella sp.]|nr:MAG: hypothetical protein E6Q43_03150 [Dokdonella sp.]